MSERPWFVACIASPPERTRAPTAIETAMRKAVAKAIFDPKHELHRQTFGFYERGKRDQRLR
jgi:hypothetical protein